MKENMALTKPPKEMNIKGSSTNIKLEHFNRNKLDNPLFNTHPLRKPIWKFES